MVYLVKSFKEDKDFLSNNNPPLSEEGVNKGKVIKEKIKDIEIDICYTSYLLKDFASALILVGERLEIYRDNVLNDLDIEKLGKFVGALPSDKNILLVCSNQVSNYLKKNNDFIEIK